MFIFFDTIWTKDVENRCIRLRRYYIWGNKKYIGPEVILPEKEMLAEKDKLKLKNAYNKLAIEQLEKLN